MRHSSADGNSGNIPETITYSVTVQNSGNGNKFYLDGVEQQELSLIEGNTCVFDKSTSHPLRFSSVPDGTHWRHGVHGRSYV